MKVTIKYYGMDGEGRNLTEAKKDAGAKIEKALSGYYTPEILRHDSYVALVARDPWSGWGYRLIHDDCSGPVYLNTGREDKREIIQNAYVHMAQCAGHYRGLEHKITVSQQRELDHYFAFQADYARLRAEGKTDIEAHAMALNHPDYRN